MPSDNKRIRQIADLIKVELAMLLKKEIHDPRLESVMISGVELTDDKRHARVFFTVTNSPSAQSKADAIAGFEKASGYLRHLVAQNTKLRYVPQLHFHYDETIERANRISDLINKTDQ